MFLNLFSRTFKIFLLTVVAVSFLVSFSATTFAEDDKSCTGKVMGLTELSNLNAGRIYFDSHSGPVPVPLKMADYYNKNANLSIIGLGEGLAPGDRKYAACISEETSAAVSLGEDEYVVKGWAWNDNLGFISFYCNNGKNEGVDCGPYNYGVKIGPINDGFRDLSGYAWSEAFGYISFNGAGKEGMVGPLTVNVGEYTITAVNADWIAPGLQKQYKVELLDNTPPGTSHVKVTDYSTATVLGTQWIGKGATADFGGQISLLAWDSKYLEGPGPHLTYYLLPPEGVIQSAPQTLQEKATAVVMLGGTSYAVTFVADNGESPLITLKDQAGNIMATKTVTVGQKTQFGNVSLTVTNLQSSSTHTTSTINLGFGETDIAPLGGKQYQVQVQAVNPVSAVMNVDGISALVPIGQTRKFGDVDLTVINIINGADLGSAVVQFQLSKTSPAQLTFVMEAGGQSFSYGVQVTPPGGLTGYAWSEAGIWINFGGAAIQLPHTEFVEEPGETWCQKTPKPYICVEITPDPEKLGFDVKVMPDGSAQIITGPSGGPKIADGKDNYQIDLYLRKGDGVTPLKMAEIQSLGLNFKWKDTVKRNQLAGEKAPNDLFSIAEPWKDKKGAIIYKPINITKGTFSNIFQEVTPGSGHYQLKSTKTIRSYAPTTNANISYTTSTKPPLPVKNEVFFEELETDDGEVWTNDIESNDLTLESLGFSLQLTDGTSMPNQVVYPNGKNGLSLKFRPAIELSTLYTNNFQDSIIAYRGIPMSFKVGTTENGNLNASDEKIILKLDYAKAKTKNSCTDAGIDVENEALINFIFNFLDTNKSDYVLNLSGGPVDPFDLYGIAVLHDYDFLSEENKEGLLPCDVAQGPTLYSEISYKVVEGVDEINDLVIKGVSELKGEKLKEKKTPDLLKADTKKNIVKYYGPKLPRLTTLIVNLSVVVHGNIYAPKAFSPTSSHKTQPVGSIMIDAVRNTINENIRKYLEGVEPAGGGRCDITALNDDGSKTVLCSEESTYEDFSAEDEYVVYFKDTDVFLGLNSALSGRWVLILEGGSLYIDKDVYNEDFPESGRLSIVALRPYEGTCEESNIYIAPEVKNIQANIASDCSVFSYTGNPNDIGEDGLPVWDDFNVMANVLDNQLFIQGSIASRNTIGGADLKEYLLLGTGEVLPLPVDPDQRLKTQLYDLNYLRLFRLSIELAENGLPIDQSCGKALTIEDMVAISEWGPEQIGPSPVQNNGQNCDGINPMEVWNLEQGLAEGDLVPPKDDALLSAGLDHDKDFSPVYIYYLAPDSFVFKQAGGVKTK